MRWSQDFVLVSKHSTFEPIIAFKVSHSILRNIRNGCHASSADGGETDLCHGRVKVLLSLSQHLAKPLPNLQCIFRVP